MHYVVYKVSEDGKEEVARFDSPDEAQNCVLGLPDRKSHEVHAVSEEAESKKKE